MDSADAKLTVGAPVPAILWESLQHSMNISVRRLVKDVAGSLGIQEKSILDELFRSGDSLVRPYLFEESGPQELECRCRFPVQRVDSLLLQPCAQPILWASREEKRCPEHFGKNTPGIPVDLPVLHSLTGLEEDQHLYVGEDDTVYDEQFCAKGIYQKGSKRLLLFHIEE